MTDIEIIAEDGVMTVDEAVAKWGNPDYDVVRKDNLKGLFKLMAIAEPLLARKPYVIKEKCVSCGVCIQACPLEPKAIYFHNGKPKYDHKKCIKCYCCQEMCPEQAIDVKSTVFAKIASHQWKI
jgi:MinD superfamily P-loop ATPase